MEKALTSVQADRRERKHERNRLDILEAAAVAFSKKGLSGATMQDIAAEAGYTVPTLYSYFKSKDDLVAGLLSMLHRELLATFLEPPVRGLSFPQNLELLVRRALELADRRRATLILLLELREKPPQVVRDEQGCTPFDQLHRQMAAWVEEAGPAEDFGGRPHVEVAMCLLGIWHAFFVSWMFGGCKERLADRTATIVELVLHGVCGNPKR